MPEIRAIHARVDACTFPYGEETVTLGYYPARVAHIQQADLEAMQTRAKAAGSEAAAEAVMAEFTHPLLASWDLTEEGAPYPLDVAHLIAMGPHFMGACLAAVIEQVNTGKASGLPSNGPGIATTSPMGAGKSSPVTKGMASHRKPSVPKSRSKAASHPGNSPRIQSGSPSLPPA